MLRHALFQRVVVALVLGTGIWLAGMLLLFFGYTLITETIRGAHVSGFTQRVHYDIEGTPIVSTMHYGRSPQGTQHHTLDGQPYVPTSKRRLDSQYQSVNPGIRRLSSLRLQPGMRQAPQSFPQGENPSEYYYFVRTTSNGGQGWLESYSPTTRRRTGHIGIHGRTTELPPPAERFGLGVTAVTNLYGNQGASIPSSGQYLWRVAAPDTPLAPLVFLPMEHNVYVVDLKTAEVRKLLQTDEPVQDIQLTNSSDRRSKAYRLLVRTDTAMQIYGEDLQPIQTLPLPTAERDAESIELVTALDGSTWMHCHSWNRAREAIQSTMLHYARDNSLLSEHNVELKSSLQESALAKWSLAPAAVWAPPVVMTVITTVIAPLFKSWDSGRTWFEEFGNGFVPEVIVALVLCVLISLALASLAARHARRQALPRSETLTWFLFVLLLGPAAYLGYRFHRRWPRRLPCPAGGHTLPADHFDCPTCHTEWPLPALKGIEVLEPAEA